MKSTEDLPVNEWNYQVPVPPVQTGDYWQHVVPESWPQEIPALMAFPIGTDQETDLPSSK